MKSQFLFFSQPHSLRCCCFVGDLQLAVASEKDLMVFNLAHGLPVSKTPLPLLFAAIGITKVEAKGGVQGVRVAVQGKNGLMRLYDIGESIVLFRQYEIIRMGFTRVGYLSTGYNLDGKLQYFEPKEFFTGQESAINRVAIESGETFQYNLSKSIGNPSALTAFDLSGTQLLVAEEGCLIHQFSLSQQSEGLKQSEELQPVARLQLQSQMQIKIIISLQCITGLKVLASLRDDHLYILSLAPLSILTTIHQSVRLCRPLGESIWVTGRKFVGRLMKETVQEMGRVNCLIEDMDVCGEGVAGVTEDCCIFMYIP